MTLKAAAFSFEDFEGAASKHMIPEFMFSDGNSSSH